MYLSKEVKADIFKKHGEVETNTGSARTSSVYSLTYRALTEHLKKNRKDSLLNCLFKISR